MVALADSTDRSASGLRPFDAARDIGQVTDVIGVAFADELGPSERAILREFRLLQFASPFMWLAARLTPDFNALFGGFVWVESGRIVGTLTLTRLGGTGAHWLISNVAVLPEYRRHGIARQLMQAAIDAAWHAGGRVVTLQVRHTNTSAYRLYQSLGFVQMEETLTLERSATDYPTLNAPLVPIRPWTDVDADQAFELARAVVPQAYQDLLPLRRIEFRPDDVEGWFGMVLDWTRGYKLYRLAVPDGDEFAASLTVRARLRGGYHQIEMSVRPKWRGQLEPSLVAYALRLLKTHGRRPTIAEIRSTETAAIAQLQQVGFRPTHTLDRLGLALGPLHMT